MRVREVICIGKPPCMHPYQSKQYTARSRRAVKVRKFNLSKMPPVPTPRSCVPLVPVSTTPSLLCHSCATLTCRHFRTVNCSHTKWPEWETLLFASIFAGAMWHGRQEGERKKEQGSTIPPLAPRQQQRQHSPRLRSAELCSQRPNSHAPHVLVPAHAVNLPF